MQWEDGSLTTSTGQYAQRLQDHFAIVFDANVVEDVRECIHPQASNKAHNRTSQPPPERVATAVQHLPSNKALGPDLVSSELLRAAGPACVAKIHELLQKVWDYAYWPVAWRGGRLQELHKTGSTRSCDNYRGLLISDHMGKAAADILYDPLDGPYHSYVPEAQCGAVKRKGADFATHVLRTLQDYTAARGLSLIILFVDLVKAFDRVLRELVLGWPELGEGRGFEYLMGLGFPEEHARALELDINSGTVLDEVMLHPHVNGLLASMHSKSCSGFLDHQSTLSLAKAEDRAASSVASCSTSVTPKR